jgi:uncharacterized pyridoxamine 5'-phosphate oxidase family protein
MHETEQDIKDFQKLVGTSNHTAPPHMKAAMEIPKKALKAEQIIRYLQGLHTVALAVSTSSGTPQIEMATALFYRTKFYIPTIRTALRTRYITHQPTVSLNIHREGELTVIVNGKAEIINPSEEEHHDEFRIVEEIHRTYSNEVPSEWKDGVYIRVTPFRFFTSASDPKSYPTFAWRKGQKLVAG